MALEPKDKELVAIGASIGALCRPCIEHHIPAARAAGLTGPEIARAAGVAEATHRAAAELLFRRSRELLHATGTPAAVPRQAEPASRPEELVALGASIGANCHPLLEQHVAGALQQGLTASKLRSAIKMARIVHQHAADITAGKAAAALEAAEPDPAAVS
jgi:AhpD family alkylhydroperoxidase